ncbi:MAG: Hcp family type VI secretion system effector [Phycisphaerae bacterium]
MPLIRVRDDAFRPVHHSSHSGFDAFLKIDGIKGDSTDAKHKDWIEINSYSHQISQAAGGAASAQGVQTGGRADHADFVITKRLDAASPNIAKYVCDGKHIPEIKFELCRAMGDKTTFMVYTFKDSVLSSVIVGPGESDQADLLPMEQVTIRYGKIKWEYTPTDPTGGGKKGATITQEFSVLENK